MVMGPRSNIRPRVISLDSQPKNQPINPGCSPGHRVMKTFRPNASFSAIIPLALAFVTSTAVAQTDLRFNREFTLAPASETSGGGHAEAEADSQAELAKKLNNPVASLISVPIQNNWDFGIGPADAMKYTANIQ